MLGLTLLEVWESCSPVAKEYNFFPNMKSEQTIFFSDIILTSLSHHRAIITNFFMNSDQTNKQKTLWRFSLEY